ncbi:MAG TPA: IS481 family transposase [Acidimicrobiales bacterium]|nr:IS481 family transposase [Acidimicrobiales bacterium]
MSKARLVITAVVLEGRSPTEVARSYGVARSWVYELVARYRVEGDTAFEPRSRRPHTRPDATPAAVVDLVVALRARLSGDGLDAGADTIRWHLEHHHHITVSRATIYRILRRHDLVVDEPRKKPKSSYVRFEAEQPNETWQADVTHHRLTDHTDAEILTWLDDHSRYALSVTAHRPVTGAAVVAAFRAATARHGIPASTLTDNGLVFTTRFANGGRSSRNGLETELAALGVRQKNSRPNHPTTCGKVERFQQTLKKWLRTQRGAVDLADLQTQLDRFVEIYNHHRPHRSLSARVTPAATYQARPKATPASHPPTQSRIRRDRVNAGSVSLRVNAQLHHIGLGRTLDQTPVILLIDDLDVRVIHATTGELLRALTIDPNRRYHGTGRPPGGPTGPRKPRQPGP